MSTSAHARPTSAPWLPATSSPARLEADLQGRGWSLWWGKDGSLKATSPDSTHTRTHHGATTAQTLREAYAAAQEYAGAALRDAMTEARGEELESLFPPRLTCPGCGLTTCLETPDCLELLR